MYLPFVDSKRVAALRMEAWDNDKNILMKCCCYCCYHCMSDRMANDFECVLDADYDDDYIHNVVDNWREYSGGTSAVAGAENDAEEEVLVVAVEDDDDDDDDCGVDFRHINSTAVFDAYLNNKIRCCRCFDANGWPNSLPPGCNGPDSIACCIHHKSPADFRLHTAEHKNFARDNSLNSTDKCFRNVVVAAVAAAAAAVAVVADGDDDVAGFVADTDRDVYIPNNNPFFLLNFYI
jgi:hypothetical protein